MALTTALFTPMPHLMLLRLHAPALTQRLQPGHFVMVRLRAGWDPFLREPLLLAGIDRAAGSCTLWLPDGSPGRDMLRHLPLNRHLDLIGPLGQPLPRRQEARHLLLVAEGDALGPLLPIAEAALAEGRSAALLAVVPPESQPYPSEALPMALEYQRAPRGDAAGVAMELLQWADLVYAAGSEAFYRDLREVMRQARPGQRGGFAFGLLLEPFGWMAPFWGEPAVACGVGACRTCQVTLRREKRLACVRGPAFDLWAL